jgi:hypothetical protein
MAREKSPYIFSRDDSLHVCIVQRILFLYLSLDESDKRRLIVVVEKVEVTVLVGVLVGVVLVGVVLVGVVLVGVVLVGVVLVGVVALVIGVLVVFVGLLLPLLLDHRDQGLGRLEVLLVVGLHLSQRFEYGVDHMHIVSKKNA